MIEVKTDEAHTSVSVKGPLLTLMADTIDFAELMRQMQEE